jgi:hypothetical protein
MRRTQEANMGSGNECYCVDIPQQQRRWKRSCCGTRLKWSTYSLTVWVWSCGRGSVLIPLRMIYLATQKMCGYGRVGQLTTAALYIRYTILDYTIPLLSPNPHHYGGYSTDASFPVHPSPYPPALLHSTVAPCSRHIAQKQPTSTQTG